ncbi:hypothetical protein niasHT_036266 [Heterodera trifolii]|uniref:Secreted protein n=1 Tax=Heterodera trifolii TaxID=157864 RepID=A0ABD2IMN8_9BILA
MFPRFVCPLIVVFLLMALFDNSWKCSALFEGTPTMPPTAKPTTKSGAIGGVRVGQQLLLLPMPLFIALSLAGNYFHLLLPLQ